MNNLVPAGKLEVRYLLRPDPWSGKWQEGPHCLVRKKLLSAVLLTVKVELILIHHEKGSFMLNCILICGLV